MDLSQLLDGQRIASNGTVLTSPNVVPPACTVASAPLVSQNDIATLPGRRNLRRNRLSDTSEDCDSFSIAVKECHALNPGSPYPDEDGSSSSRKRRFTPGRRLAHVLSEQKRRSTINEGFAELRQVIPFCNDAVDSKSSTLKKAVSYIKFLHQEIERSKSQSVTPAERHRSLLRDDGAKIPTPDLSPTLHPCPPRLELPPFLPHLPSSFQQHEHHHHHHYSTCGIPRINEHH